MDFTLTLVRHGESEANVRHMLSGWMDVDLTEHGRKELEELLNDKMAESNNIVHEKYITISAEKKNIKEARTYFARVGSDLAADFAKISSQITELGYKERLRLL